MFQYPANSPKTATPELASYRSLDAGRIPKAGYTVDIGVKPLRRLSTRILLAISRVSRYYLDMLRFDWDERKNKSNRIKHGVWFEEAHTVFSDPHGRLF